MVFRSGPTVQNMRANGWPTGPRALANSHMQLETSIKDRGSMTRRMGKAHTLTWMAPDTKVSGKMTSSMVMVLKSGRMVQNIRASTALAQRVARGTSRGRMVQCMTENSLKTTSMEKVLMCGVMAASSVDNG